MEIAWLGNSCFLIKTSLGKRILTDPIKNLTPIDNFIKNIDLVTVSHNHFCHNNIEPFKETSTILNSCGYFDLNYGKIYGIPSYHDKVKGIKRGNNIIFIIEIDDMRICHLGDLGHILDKEIIDQIGNIDILFIPIGGNFTLNGKEAFKLTKSINSKIIIPMHYKTSKHSFLLEDASSFLTHIKLGRKIESPYLLIKNIDYYKDQEVILLNPI